MSKLISISAAVAASVIALLAPASALASVKCQCNNGAISYAMDADYDDDDVAEECDDACSMMGGGRVWDVDTDPSDDDDDTTIRRVVPAPAQRRR